MTRFIQYRDVSRLAKLMLALCFGTLFLLLTSIGKARTIYVNRNVRGLPNRPLGSQLNPCHTVSEAVNVAGPGDVISIQSDCYLEEHIFNENKSFIINKRLRIVATGGTVAIGGRKTRSSTQDCGCPERHEVIEVRDDITLSDDCNYENVTFRFMKSNVVFDGNGKTLRAKNPIKDLTAFEISNSPTEPPLHDIKINNCSIEEYVRGIRIWIYVSGKLRRDLKDTYWALEDYPEERYLQLTKIDSTFRAKAPYDIAIENVHINSTRREGFYVYSYVHDVTFDRGSIRNTAKDYPAIYLDAGSCSTTISSSTIMKNGYIGIAVDGSAYNRILKNSFQYNRGGGIFLYKNCYERHEYEREEYYEGSYSDKKAGFPRNQHSKQNVIQNNKFVGFGGEGTGVWIASRQSRNRKGKECGDPVILERNGAKYYRDYAEDNRVEGNTFINFRKGVVVEDDGANIIYNHLQGNMNVGVEIGSKVRNWIGDPVSDTEVRRNFFDAMIDDPIRHLYCAKGTQFSNNRIVYSNGTTKLFVGPPSDCK